MAADIPAVEPAEFNAGSTVKFTIALSDYLPADGWTLSYVLIKTTNQITWSGSNNGDGAHLINIAATLTAAYAPGIYNWQSYITKGAERYDIAAGQLEIKPNFAAMSSGYDGRSDVKIALDAITAVLKNRASQDQQAYTISGRSLSRTPLNDLISLHKRYLAMYRAELDRERKKQGKPVSSTILTKL